MDYVPVRVSTLRGDQKISFDVYITIGDRYVLYVRRGDYFTDERLQKLKDKKIKKLYITAIEEQNYREYVETYMAAAFKPGSGRKLSARAEIIHGIQRANAEAVFADPGNEDDYKEASATTKQYVEFLLNEEGAFKEMLAIENGSKGLAHHCVTVSTLAICLAERLGTVDRRLYHQLALGALLHDLGHFQTSLSIDRSLTQLSPEEMKLYVKHPQAGGEIARDKRHFDEQVIAIIMQHHEYSNGTGFPNNLQEKKIDPLALVVGVCDCYDRMVAYEGLDHATAAKSMMLKHVGDYPLKYINELTAIVKELH